MSQPPAAGGETEPSPGDAETQPSFDAETPAFTGGCLCGAVRYQVTAPFVSAGYCHCTRCQRRTGTGASANGRIEPGSFRVTAGAELLRAFRPEAGFEKWFCGECGSALFSRSPTEADEVGVRLGTLDSDPGVRPSYRQFIDYAAVWEEIPEDGLTRCPERHVSAD